MLPLLSEDSEVQFVSPELATQHLTSLTKSCVHVASISMVLSDIYV